MRLPSATPDSLLGSLRSPTYLRWQAGLQVFGYALFFMNDGALGYLNKSDGWEVGVGPSIVVMDQGMGKSMTTTTMTQDVYAYIFSQKGLMGGMGVQGSKITRLD